ncbi:MAG: hypothetical protein WA865_10660 [Spirulinaceae cyanobacterium]
MTVNSQPVKQSKIKIEVKNLAPEAKTNNTVKGYQGGAFDGDDGSD